MLLFLIAPDLLRIPAFNLGGTAWYGAPAPRKLDAELRVGFEPVTGLVMCVCCASWKRQMVLRTLYCRQTATDVPFAGQPVEMLDVRALKAIARML